MHTFLEETLHKTAYIMKSVPILDYCHMTSFYNENSQALPLIESRARFLWPYANALISGTSHVTLHLLPLETLISLRSARRQLQPALATANGKENLWVPPLNGFSQVNSGGIMTSAKRQETPRVTGQQRRFTGVMFRGNMLIPPSSLGQGVFSIHSWNSLTDLVLLGYLDYVCYKIPKSVTVPLKFFKEFSYAHQCRRLH